MEDVPEAERRETARQVAEKILAGLRATVAYNVRAASAEATSVGSDGATDERHVR